MPCETTLLHGLFPVIVSHLHFVFLEIERIRPSWNLLLSHIVNFISMVLMA
jgi:hypothetical protein